MSISTAGISASDNLLQNEDSSYTEGEGTTGRGEALELADVADVFTLLQHGFASSMPLMRE